MYTLPENSILLSTWTFQFTLNSFVKDVTAELCFGLLKFENDSVNFIFDHQPNTLSSHQPPTLMNSRVVFTNIILSFSPQNKHFGTSVLFSIVMKAKVIKWQHSCYWNNQFWTNFMNLNEMKSFRNSEHTRYLLNLG